MPVSVFSACQANDSCIGGGVLRGGAGGWRALVAVLSPVKDAAAPPSDCCSALISPHRCSASALFAPPASHLSHLPVSHPPPLLSSPFALFLHFYLPSSPLSCMYLLPLLKQRLKNLSVSGVNPQVAHAHRKLTASMITYYCLSLHPFPKSAHNRKCPCYLYRQ